ncbi:MAG: hypothetical protein J0H79_11475 [Alphaproteobacteria bacterium]|nr:hypothetical protein [Alphaproteobacteria bacterium]
MDLQWWIATIGVPLVGMLFWMRFRDREIYDKAIQSLTTDLANYKLNVATSFASIAYLKDIENRIMSQLQKIDEKVDRLSERRPPE